VENIFEDSLWYSIRSEVSNYIITTTDDVCC
jgi:hypothetical protein